MRTPIRVLAALSVITIVGIAAGMIEPPATHGAEKPVVKAKTPPAKIEPLKTEPAKESKPAKVTDSTDAHDPVTLDTKPAPARTTEAGKKGNASAPEFDHPSPEQALRMLEDGNARWASNSEKGQHLDGARRTETAEKGQTPFAAILTCADSRIPVEHVFDQGVGDLFVVRVAGNTAGLPQTGSLEYGVEHLHTPVLVVLGHTKCGAVSAAATNADVHGNIAALVKTIEPSVERAQKLNPTVKEKDLIPIAIRENVWQSIFDVLRSSGPCREAVAKGELKVIGAVYDIATGKVEWLGEHPWQSELIAAFAKEQGTTREATATDETSEHESERR